MRVRYIVALTLATFLLIGPIISFALRAATESDSGYVPDSAASQKMAPSDRTPRPLVLVLTIDGPIGAVTDTRIADAIQSADKEGAELLVIEMDTPGGFTKPTWSICKNILNSPVPIAVYIAPSGARAGSAGVYITYAAHFAAMAPSTNIGAAHPVSGGGQEIDSVMNEKITHDAAAQIRAAAHKRGRNAAWAERAVRESVAITDQEALDSNVIDVRAHDLDDLLAQLDGRQAELPYDVKTLTLKNARVEVVKTSWYYKFLDTITQPDIAFILFSIGGLGIMLELYNPGAILPGVVGAICLIMAFYSFQTLPINYAGVALIILAIILFIAEIKVVSHGLLTVGGLVALFLGGLMLVDAVDPSLRVSVVTLLWFVGFVAALVIAASYLVIKAHRRQPFTGNEGMVGKTAVVRKPDFVYIDGALWKAVSVDGAPLEIGSTVEVVGMDKLTLKVKRIVS